jgi:hypothetical protein
LYCNFPPAPDFSERPSSFVVTTGWSALGINCGEVAIKVPLSLSFLAWEALAVEVEKPQLVLSFSTYL